MQVQPGKPGSTVGVWEGLSLANCNTSAPNRCNAQNKISITLLQGDSGLRGFYTCGYSTMDCLGQNETGKVVEASLNGGQITAPKAFQANTPDSRFFQISAKYVF